MNYKRVYNNIIEKRKNNPLDETEYGELHHIIPRSLGGTDESDNLIRLSAREHFICHALLAEMYEEGSNEWYRMNHAFMYMKCSSINHGDNRYFNSRLYELKRKDFSKVMSELNGGENNPFFGKTHTEEAKQQIRNTFRLKNKDKLLSIQRKQLERENEIVEHTTDDGIYFNKYRRNKIKEIFDIDLEINFQQNVVRLKNLLDNLYNEEKLSTVEIGKKYNKSDETIRLYMKLFDIKRRSQSQSLINYCNK